MEYAREYGEAFMALAKRMHLDFPDTPYNAINEWKALVEQIEDGYPNIHVDLEYDLEITREPIEIFLVDPELKMYADHQTFKEKIEELDKKFLEVSFEHPNWKRENDFRWWSNRVLKYGSREYADFINSQLGKDSGILIKVIR